MSATSSSSTQQYTGAANEGEKGFHQKWMKMGKRHAFKASMALHAAAVFVSTQQYTGAAIVLDCIQPG
jgi:hypothetical protein